MRNLSQVKMSCFLAVSRIVIPWKGPFDKLHLGVLICQSDPLRYLPMRPSAQVLWLFGIGSFCRAWDISFLVETGDFPWNPQKANNTFCRGVNNKQKVCSKLLVCSRQAGDETRLRELLATDVPVDVNRAEDLNI